MREKRPIVGTILAKVCYNFPMTKYQKIDKVLDDIKKLKYQGATAVARATVEAYRDFGLSLNVKRPANWLAEMKAVEKYLIRNNRPTEPLARNGLRYVWNQIKDQPTQFMLTKTAEQFIRLVRQCQDDISILGRLLIKKNSNILTHCHATTVENLLVQTYAKKKFKVFSTETRPVFQGRITAANLSRKKIPVTQVVDSAAPFLISGLSGKDIQIDTVIIGADVLLPDGSVVNKIGSYGIALAAVAERTPVYVATTLLKYSPVPQVTIEKRPMKEIWPQAPAGLKLLNFAFDIIPANLITGVVCEFGVIEPTSVKEYVRKQYPWISAS